MNTLSRDDRSLLPRLLLRQAQLLRAEGLRREARRLADEAMALISMQMTPAPRPVPVRAVRCRRRA